MTTEHRTTIERTTYAEADAALGAIGGLAGVPILVQSVTRMMPGASMPESWATWLAERIDAREPFALTLSTASATWRLEVA